MMPMGAARDMPFLAFLRRLGAGAKVRFRSFRDRPLVRRVRALLRLLAEAGTSGYPPDVKRRLKILNMVAYLIAVTTLIYAVQQTVQDARTYAPMIVLNLALVVMMLLVPFAHRISEIAGGLLIVGAEYAALLGFGDFFSREGGAQLQYLIAAAAAFVIFGLNRIWLIIGVVGLGLILHICSWFWFPALGVFRPPSNRWRTRFTCRAPSPPSC